MRILFFLLFIFLGSASLFSQQPTSKEIEAQKQEAVKDAKQQATDLKKDIAEAKTAKEDPESIKEMEKQLAMLEKMVTMLEKTSVSGKQRSIEASPSETVEPKFVSPFTPIGLKQPVSIPTEKEATDQLFWYRGKKIDANTLITTSGTIVRYDKAKSKLIFEPRHGPDPDTINSYYGLLHTLKQTPKIKNLFASDAYSMMNSFFMYPQIQGAYDEFDLMSNRFYDLANNTHNINRPTAPVDIRKMIENLRTYVKNLPGVKTIILPPKNPVGNCLCESQADAAQYEKDLQAWISKFFEEELNIIHRLLDIFDEIATEPGPNSYKTYEFGFEQYLDVALKRANYKLEELLKEYEASDVETIVVEEGLVFAKRHLEYWIKKYDLSLLGTEPGGTYSKSQDLFKRVKDAVYSTKFEDYILLKKASKEFNHVFNYLFYASHEYNKKILSPGYKPNDNIKKWLESLEDYNRFTLSVKIEFEYEVGDGKEKMTANGEYESHQITTSLGVEDCLFNLRVTDANYRDKNGDEEKLKIPLSVTKGVKQYPKQPPMFYSGPPTVMMLFPRFKISFCGDPSEVKLNLLTYRPSDIQQHISDNVSKVYTTDMLAYANKMFLGLVKTYTNLNDLVNTGDKMMNMNNPTPPKSTGNRWLDFMRMDHLKNTERYDLEYDQAAATHTGKTILKLGTLSPKGSPILGPNPYDLVDQFDKDGAIKITYAYITLELIHSPK